MIAACRQQYQENVAALFQAVAAVAWDGQTKPQGKRAARPTTLFVHPEKREGNERR